MATVPELNPETEKTRLSVLDALGIMDTAAEAVPDAIARAAGHTLETPIALVSLVDENRQWFKACIGLNVSETPREISFCTHAIMQPDDVMIIPDAFNDPRFRDNPLVTGEPNVCFYIGAPIVVRGQAIGSLCCIDNVPRHDTSEGQIAALRELAGVVGMEFESRLIRQHARALEKEHRVIKARIALALDAADMTVWTWDLTEDSITNYGGGDDDDERTMTLETFLSAVMPGDRAGLELAVADARAGELDYRAEYRLASDPNTWWLAVGYALDEPGGDGTGPVQLVTGVQANITQQKKHDETLQATAEEMRHRVNNLIGLADALAGRTARETADINAFITLYRSRLQALARTQKMLMSADGRASLTSFAEAVVEPFRRRDRSVIRLDLPDMDIEGGIAQTLTLVFHELATNALKYGALRWPFGEVVVTGECRTGNLHLNWHERANDDGVGVPLEDYVEIASSRRGRSIVDRMVSAQGGVIDFVFNDAGLDVKLDLPLK